MVMSELTGGVDMMGLLVFSISYTYGRYIDPDQQGDCPTYLQPTRCFVTMRCSSRNMLLTDESLMKQHPFLSAMQQRHLIPTGLTERLQAIIPSIDGRQRDVYRLPGIEPLELLLAIPHRIAAAPTEAWVRRDASGLFLS